MKISCSLMEFKMEYTLRMKPWSLTECTIINCFPLDRKASRPQMEWSLQHNGTEWQPWIYISSIYTVDLPLLLYFTMLLKYDTIKALIWHSMRICHLFFAFVYLKPSPIIIFIEVNRPFVNLIDWANFVQISFALILACWWHKIH